MNNEIKEILQDLKNTGYKKLAKNIENIIDYITNLKHTEDLYNQLLKDYDELQQENNNLKTSLDESQEVVIDLQQENERLRKKLAIKKLFKKYKVQTPENFEIRKIFELQRRIEKAIEYMKKHIEKCNIDGYEGKFDNFDIFTKPQKLIDILNGEDNE